jgi:hypothetical protein
VAADAPGASRGRRAAAGRGAPRSSARDRALDRWLGSPWMALPVLGLALAVRFIHFDQLRGSSTPFQPTAAELETIAALGLGAIDPDSLRLAGVVLSALTAVVVQRLGTALVGPATGLYAGLWMALWWPAVALAPLVVPATPLTLALALALAGVVAVVGAKRPYPALTAGIGTGAALVLDAASIVLVPVGWLAFALHQKWKRSTKVVAAALFLGSIGATLVGLNALMDRGDTPLRLGLDVPGSTAPLLDAAVRSPEAMAEDPWGTLSALGGRVVRLAAWPEPAGRIDIAALRVRSWVLRLPFPAWEFALPLGLLGIGLAFRGKKRAPGPRLLAAVTIALLALTLRAPVTAESRLPLVPALVSSALYGIGVAWGRFRAGAFRRSAARTKGRGR